MSLKTILATITIGAAAILGTSCQQQQQQRKPYPIYFHTQAGGMEEGAKAVFRFNGEFYTKVPILTHDNIAKFRSFLAEDGSYGVEFYLKDRYRSRLEHISVEYGGRKLLPIINGLVFEPQRLDRPITDGELVIWSGLNGYDLKQIGRTIKPINPEIEKARYKKDNPRKLPPRPKNKNQVRDHSGRVIGEVYQDR